MKFFLLILFVSGGYIEFLLVKDYLEIELFGIILDDVVGEVYDKVVCMLGLGYLGGLVVDRLVY